MPYSLTQWAIGSADDNPYAAPEQSARVLHGICPERAAEVGAFLTEPLTTSAVVAFDPATRIATTASGTQYRLDGDPEPAYAAWCKANGHDFTRLLAGRLPTPSPSSATPAREGAK